MRYRLLGKLEVLADDGSSIAISAPKRRELLAVLLLSANRPVSQHHLCDALWSFDPPPAAHESLQAHVSRLRREIGAGRIQTSGSGYSIRIEPGELDILLAETEIEAARAATLDARWRTARDGYLRALALWRGPALADFADATFAQPEIVRLDELRRGVLEDWIEAELTLGRHGEVIPELERLISTSPYRERLWQHLMLALYRSGRQADALAAYRRLRSRLREDLGIDPSSSLEELQRRILRHDPGLDMVSRGKDRVRLPVPRDPLIGREELLEQALGVVREHRLVTLTGPGGVGKTRVAIAVASSLVADYPDGLVFVDLSAVREPRMVIPTIGEQMNAGDRFDEVIGDRSILLILDNLEQVLDAAPEVDALLNRCPSLTILVTSRAPLRLRGEHRLEVPPLSGEDAGQLFIARSRALLSTSRFDASVVDEIVTRLDCLPLALELAAAQLGVLAPIALRDRLAARLGVPFGGPRDAPERHRTLHETIAWSHDLLTPEGRAAFSGLSVFAGGFDLDAAAAVADVRVEVLGELVEHSLVRATNGRYRMLETIREFALNEAEAAGATAGLRQKHLDYFRHLPVESTWVDGLLPERGKPWFDLCARERDNLRLAFEWASDNGDDEAVVQLFMGMGMYWLLVGAIDEGWSWAQRAVAASPGLDLKRRAIVLSVASEFPRFGGSLGTALDLKLQCLAIAREAGDHHRVTTTLKDLAWVYAALDDDARAVQCLDEAMASHDEAGCDPIHRRHTIGVAAEVSLRAGRLQEALRLLDELTDLEALGPTTPEWDVESATIRGYVQHALGNTARAMNLFRQSIQSGARLELRSQVAEALDGLAATELDANTENAAQLMGMADRMRAEAGSQPWLPEQRSATVAALEERLGSELYAEIRARGYALGIADVGDAIGGINDAPRLSRSQDLPARPSSLHLGPVGSARPSAR